MPTNKIERNRVDALFDAIHNNSSAQEAYNGLQDNILTSDRDIPSIDEMEKRVRFIILEMPEVFETRKMMLSKDGEFWEGATSIMLTREKWEKRVTRVKLLVLREGETETLKEEIGKLYFLTPEGVEELIWKHRCILVNGEEEDPTKIQESFASQLLWLKQNLPGNIT